MKKRHFSNFSPLLFATNSNKYPIVHQSIPRYPRSNEKCVRKELSLTASCRNFQFGNM